MQYYYSFLNSDIITHIDLFGCGCKEGAQHLNCLINEYNLLGVVGTCCVVHVNENITCQRCWRKVVTLALIKALSVPRFSCSLSL